MLVFQGELVDTFTCKQYGAMKEGFMTSSYMLGRNKKQGALQRRAPCFLFRLITFKFYFILSFTVATARSLSRLASATILFFSATTPLTKSWSLTMGMLMSALSSTELMAASQT